MRRLRRSSRCRPSHPGAGRLDEALVMVKLVIRQVEGLLKLGRRDEVLRIEP